MTTPSEPRHREAAEDLAPSASVDDGATASESAPEVTQSLYGARDDQGDTSAHPAQRRPAELWGGAIFLTLAALPVAISGLLLALQPGSVGANLKQKITDAGASANADTVLTGFKVGGGVLFVLGVLFVVFAWQAIKPKRSARKVVTVMVVVEVVLLVFAMVVSAPDPVLVGMLLLAVAGTVLLYLPRSEEFVSYRR